MRQSTPGLSRDQFLTILDNADDWNSFYNGTFYILWDDELENLYPNGMPSSMREMWTKIRELVENLWSFTMQYVDPLGMTTSALTSYLEALAELSFFNVDTDNVKLLFLVSLKSFVKITRSSSGFYEPSERNSKGDGLQRLVLSKVSARSSWSKFYALQFWSCQVSWVRFI